jgi:integrase
MPTFKAVVLRHQIKSDKTVRIKIRVTHERESKYIDSGLTASVDDLVRLPKKKSFKIKTQDFIDETNEIIKSYRDKCNKFSHKVSKMDCGQLIDYLTEKNEKVDRLDFISFADKHILSMQHGSRARSALDYKTAINALKRYIGQEKLPVKDITALFLKGFSKWISENPVNKENKYSTMLRAPSHYLGSIRTIHNEMKFQFNDEDNGIIVIPWSPFVKFKVPKPPQTEKRTVSPELIKKIFELPDKVEKRGSGSSRYNLAKDCFLLSFLLIGMNSADLYDCADLSDGKLRYYRKKTRGRRGDRAEIVVYIQPEAQALVEKYSDKSGVRVFNFYQQYSTESTFNTAINKGLKYIEKELEFYSARHSWASIARNKVLVDKYTVHEALNHVDEKMKTTDIYLEKDWSLINDANRKVLDYVFKKKPVKVIKIKSKSPDATQGLKLNGKKESAT